MQCISKQFMEIQVGSSFLRVVVDVWRHFQCVINAAVANQINQRNDGYN